MNSISPVLTEAEVLAEQVIALEQKQYYPVYRLPHYLSGQGRRTERLSHIYALPIQRKRARIDCKRRRLNPFSTASWSADAYRITDCDAGQLSVGGLMSDYDKTGEQMLQIDHKQRQNERTPHEAFLARLVYWVKPKPPVPFVEEPEPVLKPGKGEGK